MSHRYSVMYMFIVFILCQVNLVVSIGGFDQINSNGNMPALAVAYAASSPEFARALDVFREVKKSLKEKNSSDTPQCLVDLDAVFSEAVKGKMWALKMIDSTSKFPSGLLEGNIADLGEYDECVYVGTPTTPSDIKAQHCLIAFNMFLNSSIDTGIEGAADAIGNSFTFTFAVCLPKSCSVEEIQEGLTELINITSRFNPSLNKTSLTLSPTDCHTIEDVPFTFMEWLAVIICLVLATLVIVSTSYDWIKGRSRATSTSDMTTTDQLMTSFSVLSNGRKLLNTTTSPESFPVLNCLKVISILWVVVGHKYRFTAENPLINLLELPGYLKHVENMLLLNAALSVDVFFAISALLVTYGYLKSGLNKPATVTSHLANIVHRYIRLTPAFAFMILITGTWLYRMGDGPLWDRIAGNAKENCQDYWWSGLLYINNYYNPNTSCMMQSWYLAADMQLYLFAPVVLYPLLKWPRWGLVLLAICVVFSIAVPFTVAFIMEIKTPIALSRNTERVRRETDALYLPTHTKTISYIIGIFVGYILFQIKVKKVEFRLKKTTTIFVWVVAIALLLSSIFGCYPLYQYDIPYNRWTSSAYIGLYRLGWSLGIGWIIIACSTGHGGFLTPFVSWRVFGPLGRLTYGVYLVHVAVIIVRLGRMRNSQYFDHLLITTDCIGEFVISIFFAAILTLVLESPLMALEKLIFRREPGQRITIELPKRVTPSNLASSLRIVGGTTY